MSSLLLGGDSLSPVLLKGGGCLADVTSASDFKHHGLQLVVAALKLRFLSRSASETIGVYCYYFYCVFLFYFALVPLTKSVTHTKQKENYVLFWLVRLRLTPVSQYNEVTQQQ